MNELKIPNHIGVIADGNRRWARERGLKAIDGHKAGVENIEKLFSYMINRGVKVVSAYVFSTENFKRSEEEVKNLMDMAVRKLKFFSKKYNDENIRVVFSGKKNGLRDDILEALEVVTEKTKNNTRGIINFCFNYDGNEEIVDATKKIYADVNKGLLNINDLNREIFAKYLYQELPPVDLVIRTSGEMRTSSFMLWESAYSELYFCQKYFPDFKESEFEQALIEYNKRDRRFGGN